MASNYLGFPVTKETTAGEIVSVGAGVSIKCRVKGAGADLAESPLTTNGDGEIVAGSFASTSPGDEVVFRGENLEGMSAESIVQVTT